MEDLIVSYQDNYWSEIRSRELLEVLNEIKSDQHKTITDELRTHYINADGLYGIKKKKLPVATFCANFNGSSRTKENLNNYNSVMIIDIDDLGLEYVKRVFDQLSSDTYVFALWLSPSGNGIKGLIQLSFEENINPNEIDIWHYSAFAKISSYFKEKYQINLDQSGKDFTRLCFISQDKNIVIKNDNITERFLVEKDAKLKLQNSGTAQIRRNKGAVSAKEMKNILHNPLNRNSPTQKKEIQSIIKFLNKNKKSITYEYDNWLRVALAISSSFTYDLGITFFKELSKMDKSKFDETNCVNMLKECYINNKKMIKFNTIIHLAVQKGFVYKNDFGLESN
jgi:hypothetical protein